jgi:glycosyltransferase, family 2
MEFEDIHMEEDGIAILMATYNGSRFIREQVLSLMSQDYKDFNVYVRDDGSTDDTLEILKDLMIQFPGRIEILRDPVQHRGPRDAFMYLLKNVEARYYMFCDQDDVWLPFKVSHTLHRMQEVELKNPGKPVMIHTDLRVVDSNLDTIGESFWKWRGYLVDVSKNFNYTVMGNIFTGCTIMINRGVRDLAFPISDYARMHDEWIGLVTAKHGVVENLKEQTILYRQHSDNVCSGGEKKELSPRGFALNMLYDWYYDRKPILDYFGYGSVVKGIYYKSLYLMKRYLTVKNN